MVATADLSEAATAVLSNCGSDLCLDLRFLTRAVLSLEVRTVPGTAAPWCDGETMVFDPGTVIRMFRTDPRLVTRTMAHMALHCILGHTGGGDDPLVELARDMVVEYVLDSLDSPHTSVDGRNERMYTCERIFGKAGAPVTDLVAEQLRNVSRWQMDDMLRTFTRDDHSRHPAAVSPMWDDLSKQAMTEVEAFSRNLEDRSGMLMDVLRIRNRRRYDYRSFLHRFMTARSRIRENLDEFDHIYYTYGMSVYGNIPLIDSLEYSDTPAVEGFVIAVDTSGSTMRGPVMRFLEEAFEVLRLSGLGRGGAELHVIQCDDEVRSDVTVRNEGDMRRMMAGFELIGGGGTDFRPVFDHVDSLVADGTIRNMRGLMYFTDGMGTFPTKRPDYDTAFVFCDDMCAEHAVPPWAMRIVVRTGDLID